MSLLHSSTRRLHYMFLYFKSRESYISIFCFFLLKIYELVFNWRGKEIKMIINIHFYLDIFQQCFEIFQNVFWLILLYYWKIPSQILGNLWQVCFEDFNQEDSPSKIRQNSTCSMGQIQWWKYFQFLLDLNFIYNQSLHLVLII